MTLGKPDFTVQESGKPRAITTFVGPEAKPAAPPQLQPNEFSNLPDFREASGAIFVVLDTIDTRYVDERDARPLILKFLGKAAQAKHAVTLGILSDKGLHLYHDYRTGSDVLLAALIKAGLGGMKGARSSARRQRRGGYRRGGAAYGVQQRRSVQLDAGDCNCCAPTSTCL